MANSVKKFAFEYKGCGNNGNGKSGKGKFFKRQANRKVRHEKSFGSTHFSYKSLYPTEFIHEYGHNPGHTFEDIVRSLIEDGYTEKEAARMAHRSFTK